MFGPGVAASRQGWLTAVPDGLRRERRTAALVAAAPFGAYRAYGALVVQGFLLIGLAVALRPLPLPAETTALLVAAGSVTGSFALAWLLITRVPWLGRVL